MEVDPATPLEYSAFPHIVENIARHLQYETLLEWRLVSRAVRETVDGILAGHLIFDIRCREGNDGLTRLSVRGHIVRPGRRMFPRLRHPRFMLLDQGVIVDSTAIDTLVHPTGIPADVLKSYTTFALWPLVDDTAGWACLRHTRILRIVHMLRIVPRTKGIRLAAAVLAPLRTCLTGVRLLQVSCSDMNDVLPPPFKAETVKFIHFISCYPSPPHGQQTFVLPDVKRAILSLLPRIESQTLHRWETLDLTVPPCLEELVIEFPEDGLLRFDPDDGEPGGRHDEPGCNLGVLDGVAGVMATLLPSVKCRVVGLSRVQMASPVSLQHIQTLLIHKIRDIGYARFDWTDEQAMDAVASVAFSSHRDFEAAASW